MGVIFSNKCEIAIKSILYLSILDKYNLASVKDISEKLGIFREYAAKVLQELVFHGFVESKRGKYGGFSLARELEDIKLIEIIQSIDGNDLFENCLLGFPGCGSCTDCPVHDTWGGIRNDLKKLLSSRTLGDLKPKTEKKLLEMILGDTIKIPSWGCQG